MRRLRNLSIGLSMMAVFGCSSAVTIKSTPSTAEVGVRTMGQTTDHKLGKTPMSTSLGDLPESVEGSKVLIFTISKEGFLPKTVYLTETRSVDVELDVKLERQIEEDNSGELNELIDALFDSQKAAQRGELEVAHKILDGLELRFKTVAAVYEMRGGLYILEKNKPMALRSFSRALALNPASTNVRTIVRSLGGDPGRLPAMDEKAETPEQTSSDGVEEESKSEAESNQ